MRRPDACPAVKVGESNALPRQDCNLTVVEEHHVARMGQDGGDVGGDEKLAVTQPHHDWRAVARGDDDLGVVGRDQHDGKQAAQLPQRAADGGLEPVAPHLALDQVRDNLGIGFGDEPVAVGLERRLEVEIVLDDAVVHDHQAARAIPVGMSVFLGGAAVGGPPRVTQAVAARDRVGGQDFLEPGELARASPHVETSVADQRDASRVVAPVFEPPESLDQDRQHGTRADVTDDAAHYEASMC